MVEPYVTYGYPSLKTVRDVIYKRGHGKVNKQRIPLTDNAIIEKVLGQFGIICMEVRLPRARTPPAGRRPPSRGKATERRHAARGRNTARAGYRGRSNAPRLPAAGARGEMARGAGSALAEAALNTL